MVSEKLKTLVVLDQEKSYTKTAKICNITQPAVTQHIQALERNYNIIIFNKIGKDLVTTAEGKILIKYAKRLLAINKNIKKELVSSLNSHQILDIGITLTASDYFIPEILNAFKKKFPDTRFNFHTDNVENIFSRLKYSELDFAIIDGSPNYRNFESHLLTMDELILIVPVGHPFTKYNEVVLEMIKKEKLILRHKNANTRILFENFLTNNLESIDNFDVILEVENIALIRHLVRDGHGISIISKSICESDLNKNLIKEVKIKNFKLERGIYLIHQKKAGTDQLIQDILNLELFGNPFRE